MTRIRFTACLTGLLVPALSLFVAAQSQAPTFRSGVALVTLDVAAFDQNGRPVAGLGPEAFEVKLDGRVQPVRVVSYLEARGELPPQEAASSSPQPSAWDGRVGRQTHSNAGVIDPRAPSGEDRVFVILVDDLSIPPTRGQRLLAAAQRFVAAVPAIDPIGVIYSSDPSKPVGPTLDRGVVSEALRTIKGGANLMSLQIQGQGADDQLGSPVGLSQAVRIDQGGADAMKDAIAISCFGGDYSVVDAQPIDVLIADNQCAGRVRREARVMAAQAKQIRANQLGAIEGVIRAMGSASGIRHLVIVSDGIAVGREVDALQPLAQAAARAGVQVSVLMEEHDMHVDDQASAGGGGTTARRSDIGAPQRRIEDQRLLMDGLQTTTGLLGGQFYRVVGDPAPFFERVRTASAAVYRLGVELPSGAQPGRSMTVEARVTRPGVSTFVSRHVLVPEPTPATPPAPKGVDDKLKDAIASGQQHGAVPVQVATLLRRSAGTSGALELSINLAVPPASTGPVRGPVIAMFGLAPAGAGAGAAVNSGRRVLESPGGRGTYQTTFGVPVSGGTYRMRIAVADAEGALGALDVDLDATLPAIGPFAASDLLLAWVNETGQPRMMVLDPLPADASSIRADLELYPPASGVSLDTVQVEFTLTKAGDTDPVDDRLVTPRDAEGRWLSAAEFSAADLGPGRYTLRARVYVGEKAVGSTLATFVKTP